MSSLHIIKKRTRYFVGAEGESEQSLIKWIQELSNQKNLHIHLDCYPLEGGGYTTMLKTAASHRKRGLTKGEYKANFLLVDGDRAAVGDLSINKLRTDAEKQDIILCCQTPNIEGLFCRMLSNQEQSISDAITTKRQLQNLWPEYKKPVNAQTLARKFSLEDLLRATADKDIGTLLRKIGIMR